MNGPADVVLLAVLELLAAGKADAAAKLAHRGQTADPPTAGVVAPERMAADPQPAPATDEIATPGKDGKALARLMGRSKAQGVSLLSALVGDSLRRYKGTGPLLAAADLERLAESLASVNASANLLGRSRVHEMAERAASTRMGLHRFADESLSTFAGGLPDILATPEAAVSYFLSLFPRLGIDPDRYPGEQRRRAFTLAESCNDVLTRRVQQLIGGSLRRNESVADAAARIGGALSGAGVTPQNPQYAELVYRTNVQDSFQTGMYEEGAAEDVGDMFPVYEYLGIDDNRAGEDHRPKFGLFYPKKATFSDVRGKRPYNCRCGMRWVDKWEWDELLSSGKRLETRW